MLRKKTDGALAAYNSVVDVVADRVSSEKVSGRITNSVSMLLQLYSNSISVWQIVVGTAREEHVVVHVFPETLVTVERMELPPGVQLDSQTIDDDANRR